MKQWIKLETSLLEDPRIQKLLDSNLGFAGLGMYLMLRIYIENSNYESLHINQLTTMGNGRLRPAKIYHLICDFDLFWINGNGTVSVRNAPRASANAPADVSADAPAGEPLLHETRQEKETNKEINSENNGNHDFDPRWI